MQYFVTFRTGFAIILLGEREPVAFLLLSSWCHDCGFFVLCLFHTVPWVGLQCVIKAFSGQTHFLFTRRANRFILFCRMTQLYI